jgi:hypothetical protein
MVRKQPLEHFASILEQMKAIGYLDRIWSAAARSLSILWSPVSTENLYARMGF